MKQFLEKLNTFNKGQWIYFPSEKSSPEFFSENCNKLCKLFEGTSICLKDMKYTAKYLKENGFFVFIDNFGTPQIVGNLSKISLEYFRGICDEYEQNININYLDVANEFLDNCKDKFFDYKPWKEQINWIFRLKKYAYLLKTKKYEKIDIEMLIKDLSYNGYSLHYKTNGNDDKIYYPQVKKDIIKEPMLKPLIAKHLGCRTDEIYIGKYYGNGKNVKYVIGHMLSNYLHKDCKIKKVFGYLKIKDYQGEFTDIDNIQSTLGFQIIGSKINLNLFSSLFANGELLSLNSNQQLHNQEPPIK